MMRSHERAAPLALAALGVVGLAVFTGLLFVSRSARTAAAPATATGVWQALMARSPQPINAPLPDSVPGPFDGIYAKLDQSWPQWWLCLRCADYRPAGGIWKLQFDRGVMRIFYDVTGWRSLASYTTSGDHVTIFNDPYCPDEAGEYTWQAKDGQLRLTVVDDTCAFALRGTNLTKQTWTACPPAGAVTGAPETPGCTDSPVVPAAPPLLNLPVEVAVRGGDSRFFEPPPEVFAAANTADRPAPGGIEVSYHDESIGYGLNRILWWNGDWIEASTDLPVTSMGVQFLGAAPTGWARVLLDGMEVWRGNTSAIWSDHNRFGGYVEVSGFELGEHTLRVEALGFDYHPVEVASFGFRYSDPPAP